MRVIAGDTSAWEWLLFGMPIEVFLLFMGLGAICIVGSLLSEGVRRVFRRDRGAEGADPPSTTPPE